VAAWQRAVQAWREDGQPHPLAHALLSLAGAAAAVDRTLAADALDEACGIASKLDARPLIDAATTLARRIGVRPGPRPAGTLATPEAQVLTEREREVLRLVAEGYSNRRIADQLYISPKTASVHVSRIIAKLEVANRVEAATVAARLGLL